MPMRSRNARASGPPAASCPYAVQRRRPLRSRRAVVPAFAKSCVSAANSSTARSSPSSESRVAMRAAASSDSMVWIADVAFGMPLGVLRHLQNVRDLREVRDPSGGSEIIRRCGRDASS